MAVTKHVCEVVLHAPGGATYPLRLEAGTCTLDDSWSPFVQAAITITRPSIAAYAVLLALRTASPRITITGTASTLAGATLNTRTFDLTVRSMKTNHKTSRLTIALESDEALLRDYRLYPATAPDPAGYAFQSSLGALVESVLAKIGASLAPGYIDTDVDSRPTSMNMLSNPSLEVAGTGWFGLNATVNVDTTWAADGSRSLRIDAPTSASSWATLDGDQGGMRNGMSAGRTYTVSATCRRTGAQTGTVDPLARTICVVWKDRYGSYQFAVSPAAPNSAGVTRLAVKFTIPEGATEAFIRYFHGATGGAIWWDAFRLSEGDGIATRDTGYFDGNTTDTTDFTYAWGAASGLSASNRVAFHGRSADILYWNPGQSLWEFLQPIIESAGYRLRCGPDRVWTLLSPGNGAAGTTTIEYGVNATEMEESLDLDDGTYAEAVLITYRWIDDAGRPRVAYEGASLPTVPSPQRIKFVEIDRPPAGKDLASRLLRRQKGLLPVLDLTAISDYTSTPGQRLLVTMPGEASPRPDLFVASVVYNLAGHEMQVQSRPRDPGNIIPL